MDLSKQPIIQIKNVTRTFKDVEAVSDLSVEIYPGELFGLVGPDGAGKTTTLRILAGLLSLSGGEGSVAGFNLQTESEKIKKKIGYMAQRFSLYAELSVVENLKFFADLYDVPRAHVASRMDKLLEFANLTGFRTRRADKLSGGMQKKLALACTLIHQPEILLLDEPTTGVDPVSRREFWNILTELHVQGTTIIVSTPYMDEADRCSMVGLMYAGKLVECDTPQNIRGRLNEDVIEVQAEDWRAALETVAGLPGVLETQTYGETVNLLVDDGKKRLHEVERALKRSRIEYRSVRIAPVRMEEAFISLIRKMESA